jgi:DNA-binding CsgD family transcriptional regulator
VGGSGYYNGGIRAHVVTVQGRRFAGTATRTVIVMELGGVREARWWQSARRHPQLCDAALGLVLTVPAIIAVRVGGHGEAPRMLGAVDAPAIAAAVLAVAFRRRFTRAGLILTDREREVLALVAYGLSNDEIAERLHLSPLTVKTHINRAMTKLGVRDRAQLVVIAYQSGLVRPGEQP